MSTRTHRKPDPLRGDLQGLRGVAVLAVVLYHSGVSAISGGFVGVDLFFVLSGFLITGLLLKEIESTGRVSLRQFWGRRSRRLLPASIMVLVATALAGTKLLPFLDRKPVSLDLLWASAFSANWHFAQQQTDYLSEDRTPSPVLHFWSLGVEEQFYVLWPLLFVVAGLLLFRRRTHRWSLPPRPVFAVLFTVVLVASLTFCVAETANNQPYAFFGTLSRAWQLAAGALLAIAAPQVAKAKQAVRTLLGLVGLTLLIASMILLSEGGSVGGYAYPSLLAIAPTMAGVLLVAAGCGKPTVVGNLLALAPLRRLGDISFALYLWHWPFIVLGVAAVGDTTANPVAVKLSLCALAAAVSVVSYLLVENPIRKAAVLSPRPVLSLVFGLSLITLMVPATASLSASASAPTGKVATTAVDDTVDDSIIDLSPALDKAATDEGPLRKAGCQVGWKVTAPPTQDHCTFGDKAATRTVVSLGDSIGGAIYPALNEAANAEGWKLVALLKSGCPIADVTKFDTRRNKAFYECDAYREKVIARTLEIGPDLVVLSMSRGSVSTVEDRATKKRLSGPRAYDAAVEGLKQVVDRFKDAGIPVALVEAPVRAPTTTINCLAAKQSISRCAFPVEKKPSVQESTFGRYTSGENRVLFVELTDSMCDTKTCSPVVNRTIVLRDQLHFTATFAKTLTPLFEKTLLRVG